MMSTYKSERKKKLCATCLSFSYYEFRLSEDIKGILKSLLYDFGIDEFFQKMPPDKQLQLCDKCAGTLHNMIVFKERAQKSFSVFKKYWITEKQEETTRNTVAVPSSSKLNTPLQIIGEDPKEIKSEESDPLDIKSDTGATVNSNNNLLIEIKEEDGLNLDEIKEEDGLDTFCQPEPVVVNNHELKKQLSVNNSAAISSKDYCNHGFVNNKMTRLTSPEILKYLRKNTTESTDNLVNIKVPKVTVTSFKSLTNVVNFNKDSPSNDKLNENFVSTMKVYSDSDRSKFNNYLNASTDNSSTDSAAEDSNDLEDTIQSSILFKNNDGLLPVNYKATPNSLNSISINNTNTYNAKITNLNNLNKEIYQNNECVFNNVSNNDGQVFVKGNKKILKIVNIDNKGNINDIGEGVMFNPVTVTRDGKLVVQKSSIAITTFESPTNSILNCKIENVQNATDDSVVSAPDIGWEGHHPMDEDTINKDSEKVGSAVEVAKKKYYYTQNKWYINIVTREEILNKMEECRNHPDFLNAPFKCVHCVLKLPNERFVETHKKAFHKEDSEFTCFACLCTFKYFAALKSHYFVHTIDSHVYYCTTCDFETKEILYMRDHICPNAGSKRRPPKDPKNMKLSRCGSLYYCPKCEHINSSGARLTLHYTIQHKNNPRVKCDECGNSYKTKYGLRYHVDTVHGVKKQRAPHDAQVYCKLCSKWYLSKITYSAHVKNIHTRVEPKFHCDECDKKFLTEKKLRSHKEFHVIMQGGKNHKCGVCGGAYYTQKILKKHEARHHAKKPTSRDHVCEVCGMAFFTKMCLKHHMGKHSDERPYKCSFCGDTFKYPAALYTHKKLKHEKKKKEASPETNKQKRKQKRLKKTPKSDTEPEKRKKDEDEKRVTAKRRRVEKEIGESSSEEELIGFADESFSNL